MKTITVRKLVLCILSLAIAIIMLSSLAFPLLKYKEVEYRNNKVVSVTTEEKSGFDMMKSLTADKSDEDFDLYRAYFVPSIIWCFQIIFSCLSILAIIIGLILFRNEVSYAICKLTALMGVVFTLLYMITGWGNNFSLSGSLLGGSIEVTTLCYVPFIIVGLLAVVHYFCSRFVPEKELKLTRPNTGVSNAVLTEEQKMSILIQYKELLDNGTITEEEFNAKKQSLL